MQQWLQVNLVGLLALGLAAVVAVGGFIAFFMTTLVTTADVQAMITPLATEASVAALPTNDDLDSINDTVGDLRETVAALSSTVQALSSTVDAQNQIVSTLGEIVTQANNTVIALSGTVDQVNQVAVRADDAVGTLDDRFESLRNIVSPLVPCIIELHRELHRIWNVQSMIAFSNDAPPEFSPPLPESCEQALARARAE